MPAPTYDNADQTTSRVTSRKPPRPLSSYDPGENRYSYKPSSHVPPLPNKGSRRDISKPLTAIEEERWYQAFFAHPSAAHYLCDNDGLKKIENLKVFSPGLVPYSDINKAKNPRRVDIHMPKDPLLCELLDGRLVEMGNDPRLGDVGWVLNTFTRFGLPLKEQEGTFWERSDGSKVFQMRCFKGDRLPCGKYGRLAIAFVSSEFKKNIKRSERKFKKSRHAEDPLLSDWWAKQVWGKSFTLCDSARHYAALVGLCPRSSRMVNAAFEQLLRVLNCEFRVVSDPDDPFTPYCSFFDHEDGVITQEHVTHKGVGYALPKKYWDDFIPIDLRKLQYLAHYSRSPLDMDFFYWANRKCYAMYMAKEDNPEWEKQDISNSDEITWSSMRTQFDWCSQPFLRKDVVRKHILDCAERLLPLTIVLTSSLPYKKFFYLRAPWGPAVQPGIFSDSFK